MTIIEPEIMIALGGFIGAATGVYAGVKKWPFWKNFNDNRQTEGEKKVALDHCPDQGCHKMVIETATEVKVLREGQTEIFNRLNELPGDIIEELRNAKELFRE